MPPASNTIVLKSLSVLLGLFFIFVGTLKLTPHISKDLYKDLVCVPGKSIQPEFCRSQGVQPIDFSHFYPI